MWCHRDQSEMMDHDIARAQGEHRGARGSRDWSYSQVYRLGKPGPGSADPEPCVSSIGHSFHLQGVPEAPRIPSLGRTFLPSTGAHLGGCLCGQFSTLIAKPLKLIFLEIEEQVNKTKNR